MSSHRAYIIFALFLLLIIGFLIILYVYTVYNQNSTDKAISFLESQYNSQVGLLREYSSSTTYFLYSDNYLASKILSLHHKDTLANNVTTTLAKYSKAISPTPSQYRGLFGETPSFNGSGNYLITTIDGKQILTTLNNKFW